jgi:hypothetical protein
MSYGKPLRIELHSTMVVSGEETNQEKIMYDVRDNKDVNEIHRTKKNHVTY